MRQSYTQSMLMLCGCQENVAFYSLLYLFFGMYAIMLPALVLVIGYITRLRSSLETKR